jgi:NADH-quinone oxidoreductase subunit M
MNDKSYQFYLLAFFIFPLITMALLVFLRKSEKGIRYLSLSSLILQLLMGLFFIKYHQTHGWNILGPMINIPWITDWGIHIILGIDGMNFPFILMSSILAPIIYYFIIPIENRPSLFIRSELFFLLLFGMYGSFLAFDLVIFYILWEIVLIPVLILVGLGQGTQRQQALMKFFLFSVGSSLLMLLGIIILGINYESQMSVLSFNFFDLKSLILPTQNQEILFSTQWWSCLAFLIAFFIKAHAFPLHAWLPDLYKEGTPLASVLVSALLFNMATYAMFRFIPPFFPQAIVWWGPIIMILGAVGILYGAFCVLAQADLRQVIAYISVSHVGFFLLGFGSLSMMGFQSAYIQTINHAVLAASFSILIFLIVHKKNDYFVGSLSGLVKTLPFISIAFFISILGNIGLPGTNGFVGEFLVLLASFQKSPWITSIATLGVILSATYGLKIYQKLFFNHAQSVDHEGVIDLKKSQIAVMSILLFLIILLGLKPMNFFNPAMETLRKSLIVIGY